MKNILCLLLVSGFVFVSCSQNNQSNHKAEFIEGCLEASVTTKKVCACSYDRATESMTLKELRAFQRDFEELEDLTVTLSASYKITQATTECMLEDLNQ